MLKKFYAYWKEISIIAVSFIILRLFFFSFHPQSIINPWVSSSDIQNKSKSIASYLNYNTEPFTLIGQIKPNLGLIDEYQKKYGIEAGNKLIQQNELHHIWDVSWIRGGSMVFSSRERQMENMREFIGRLNLNFDLNGNLIGLNHGFSDTSRISLIPKEEAESIVKKFSAEYMKYINIGSLRLSEKTELEKEGNFIVLNQDRVNDNSLKKTRIDYSFIANYYDDLSKSEKRVSISVTGNKISMVKLLDYRINNIPLEKSKTIHDIINAVLITCVIVLIIVLLFKRFRAFEIGLKQGIKVAIIYSILIDAEILISINGTFTIDYLVALVVAPLFAGAGILILWTIAESLGREKWRGKFISMDLFLKGYFTDSRIGNAILKGVALGFFTNALLFVLYFAVSRIFPISITSSSGDYLTIPTGGLKLLLGSIGSTSYLFLVFMIFTVSYLKGKMKDIYLIVLCGVIYGLIDTGLINTDYIDIIIQSIIGIVFIWFFVKYDILASLIGVASGYFIFRAMPLLFIGSPIYVQSFYVIIFLIVLFLLWSLYSISTKDNELDFDSLAPAYVARITERERLKREFEIAEDVQTSLLPNKDPELSELAIAARCLPASEVGGDYYDYIEFDKNNLGIVIGDVSGKGIQASFYMTLVKGFVKAVAKQTNSPSEILNKLNVLFCENVERGNFITMVFAKINFKEKRLIFSRAGHNPVIIKYAKDSKTVLYQPKGFALGMESGAQFPRFIEEENIQLHTGDLVFLYTDGFTEAMNKNKEEFGEQRLREIIEEIQVNDPKEIIEKIFKQVKSFIGKAPQHDDMTIVVVRMN
ncbi:MAG: hypothetical protein C0412_06910 [Flavobacterium sp.]|nr:hypothetical protein [Flavobacterium sp.]